MNEYKMADSGDYVDQSGSTPEGKIGLCQMGLHKTPCAICRHVDSTLRAGLTLVLEPSHAPVCLACGKKYGFVMYNLARIHHNGGGNASDAMAGAEQYYSHALDRATKDVVINGVRFKCDKDGHEVSPISESIHMD